MAKVRQMWDGLWNAVTGLGTRADPARHRAYCLTPITRDEIEAAFRSSGLMRKVIEIPALDMVREWIDWKADAEDIEKLENEVKRLGLVQAIYEAEILRGLGGGAIVLGMAGEWAMPALPTPRAGQIAFVRVVSRWQLTVSDWVDDFASPEYGQPKYFTFAGDKARTRIHPSRVVCFKADPLPAINVMASYEDRFWGESKVQRGMDAVMNCDNAMAAFAGLIDKARNTVIGIPGLSETVSDPVAKEAMRQRVADMAAGESMYHVTLYDAGDGTTGGEKIDHRQVTWAGIPDIIRVYAETVSAIYDIPMTRLWGKAAEGMSASGQSQQQDWNKAIRARQGIQLAPCLDALFKFLIPSALGRVDASIWYDFAPLSIPTEAEESTRFKTLTEAMDKVQMSGAVPETAFNKGYQSLLVENGFVPGLESALAEIPENERFGIDPNSDGGGDDPSAIHGEGGDPGLAGSGGQSGSGSPARRAANDAASWLSDATPRPLYVQRKLLNAKELAAWAKANGFATTLDPADMHVTILYSRSEVDPMKMGRDWSEDENGHIVVRPGGPRVIEKLGENAVVLRFASPSLEYRHRDMIEAGGSHDWPEFAPHVTISYTAPDGVDVESIKPFNGELRFGPEIFEGLDLDWKSKISEA